MKPVKETLTEAKLNRTYWGERLIDAEARGHFTSVDKQEAGRWVTCACGHLDESLLIQFGGPRDELLRLFGGNFEFGVSHNDPAYAAASLIKIQARATHLLEEQTV